MLSDDNQSIAELPSAILHRSQPAAMTLAENVEDLYAKPCKDADTNDKSAAKDNSLMKPTFPPATTPKRI